MRKIIPLFIFIVASFESLFSATYNSELSRAIQLQGAYGDVVSVEFDEIAAQTQSYLIGMPFNIQDQTVQSSAGTGRVIARWSILTNTDFSLNLSIDETKLHHENGSKPYLDFVLTFTYNLAYYVRGESASKRGSFDFKTTESPKEVSIIPEGTIPDTGSFTGSVEGLISFKFDESVEGTAIDAAPVGNYVADVKMQVVVK